MVFIGQFQTSVGDIFYYMLKIKTLLE